MKRTVFLLAFASMLAQPASAEPVTDVCLAYDEDTVCKCATEALKSDIGSKDFVYYSAASATALERQSEGDSLVEAWDRATKNHAAAAGVSDTEALTQMNALGSAHRDAIKMCKG